MGEEAGRGLTSQLDPLNAVVIIPLFRALRNASACSALTAVVRPFLAFFPHLRYSYPMTIQQTIDIPVSRRITFEVPREIPEGVANITLTVEPKTVPGRQPASVISRLLHRREERQTRALMNLYGCLANNPAFGNDPAAAIRTERDAWDERLKTDEAKSPL
jgi:hypothetical protein